MPTQLTEFRARRSLARATVTPGPIRPLGPSARLRAVPRRYKPKTAPGPVRFKCGCGRLFDTLEGWRGHAGHHVDPACDEPYEAVRRAPGGSATPSPPAAGGNSYPQGGNSYPKRAADGPDDDEDGSDEYDDEGEDDAGPPPAAETVGPSGGARGTAVQEPVQPKRPGKPPAEWGLPDPSKIRESISFPVVARFMYDGYRAKYPQYHGTYAEFMQEVFMVGCRRIGMHAAVIWTQPDAPPPPAAVQPVLRDPDVERVFLDVTEEAPSAA